MWREIRQTLQLGWPIMLGNLTQIALGIIDSAMVGAIHSSQLAAASLVNNILSLPMVLTIGLSTAISPLVAAARGEGNDDQPMRILYNGAWIVTLVALVLAFILHVGADLVFHLGQDVVVAKLSRSYLIWMGWATVPLAAFFAMKQFADGLGFTRRPMYLSVAVLPLNVLLNYAFIYGHWGAPRLELTGAGVGTLVARIIVMAALGVLIFRHVDFAPFRRHLAEQLRWRRDRVRDIFRIGVPASLQYGMEAGAFAFSGIMAGWLGYQAQAAHQIAIGLASITFMVALGISAAGTIRVGYAYGRRDWPGVRQIGMTTLVIAAAYGLLCGLLLTVGRRQLPLLFNDEPTVLGIAAVLLMLAAVFQISDSVQAVGVGLLRGLQDVRIPTYFVAFAYWGVGVPAGYLLAFPLNWGVNGLWAGFVLGLSGSAILLSWRFHQLTRSRYPAATKLEN